MESPDEMNGFAQESDCPRRYSTKMQSQDLGGLPECESMETSGGLEGQSIGGATGAYSDSKRARRLSSMGLGT